MEYEETIIQLITNSGEARSCCLKALRHARKNEFDTAESLIESAKQALSLAHKTQTQLIQREMSGDAFPVSLLIIHAQDHLMNAMTIRDLVVEMIEDFKNRSNQNK